MTQNREPPCFQEYAASMLASKNYRLMNLSERGLFYAMRLECWVNREVPAKANELAQYLGIDTVELENAFTPRVLSAFLKKGESLICPELEDYRTHLNERKTKQSEGGKKGAAKVNSAAKEAKKIADSIASKGTSDLPSTPQASRESLVKHSSVKQSQNKPSLKEVSVDDGWTDSYDKEERRLNGN